MPRYQLRVNAPKELLLRLAQAGHDALRLSDLDAEATRRRGRQADALSELRSAIDWSAISDDQAWR